MIKKIYSFLLIAVMAMPAMAQVFDLDQQQPSLLPQDSMGIHPWSGKENDKYFIVPVQSHWSIYLNAGFNIYDGDFTHEKKHGVWLPTVGLGAGYHFNNTWGMGFQYKFRNYKVTGSDVMEGDDYRDARTMLRGMSHQVDAYLTFDIFNCFFPKYQKKVFALDLILGGGALIYKNSVYYSNIKKPDYDDLIKTDFYYTMTTRQDDPKHMDKYKLKAVFLGGLSAEFNLNRSFQLGLRAIYNYSTTDLWDGRPRGNNNDGAFDVELLLRYKIQPRNMSHVRNFMVEGTIDKWNNGEYYDDPEIGAAKRAKNLRPCDEGYVPQKDTLLIKDTLVILVRDTLVINQSPIIVQAPCPEPAPVVMPVVPAQDDYVPIRGIHDYVVYFANDDPELDEEAMKIVTEAASVMQQERDLLAVIIGSCDNTGAVEYNKWLAVQRAKNVTNTLTKQFLVDPSRIYRVGRGIMQDDREEGSYRLNRRVEIHLVDEAGMENAKNIYQRFEVNESVEKTSAVRMPGEGANASSSTIMEGDKELEFHATNRPLVKSEKAQPAPAPVSLPTMQGTIITVTSDMTLSKLAKQYYGNSNYWYYIYGANHDKLASPDKLSEGMQLVIPDLNEAKKTYKLSEITKMLQDSAAAQ